MKSLIFLPLTVVALYTQAQQINGLARDDNGSPLNGTTISLHKASDSAVVKLAVSKDNGAYTFTGIKEGNYRISASHIGYQTIFSAPFTLSTSDLTIPELRMRKVEGGLSNVTVVASKPIVEVKADKTILNVEGTIN